MRLTVFFIFLLVGNINAQKVSRVELYDPSGNRAGYAMGDSLQIAQEQDSILQLYSMRMNDSLTCIIQSAQETDYIQLGYDTADIKFTTPEHFFKVIKKEPGNGDYSGVIFPFIISNGTPYTFTILYEDIMVLDSSFNLIDRAISIQDIIYKKAGEFTNKFREIYINEIYLRDWKGTIIRLKQINLNSKMDY